MAPSTTQILLATGTGLAIGICATVIVQRLTSNLSEKLSQIMNKVDQLQSQLEDMKVKLAKEKVIFLLFSHSCTTLPLKNYFQNG